MSYPTDMTACKDDDAIHARSVKGRDMIRITDKSFRYTPSYNTDLKKRFRKMAQEKRAVTADKQAARDETPGSISSVVPLMARRSLP